MSMPPRDPKPANSRRESKPNLDMPETELTAMLEQYCDLRRRCFDQAAIKTKSSWTKNHQKLLLEEAQRRAMPGSQKSQEQAMTEWLLAMYDAGTELRVIQRTSALYEPANREAAANRTRRRQRASPQRPHHQKPRRNARQGFLAGRQRNPHAPAVRRRLPTQLPRRTRHTAVHRSH